MSTNFYIRVCICCIIEYVLVFSFENTSTYKLLVKNWSQKQLMNSAHYIHREYRVKIFLILSSLLSP